MQYLYVFSVFVGLPIAGARLWRYIVASIVPVYSSHSLRVDVAVLRLAPLRYTIILRMMSSSVEDMFDQRNWRAEEALARLAVKGFFAMCVTARVARLGGPSPAQHASRLVSSCSSGVEGDGRAGGWRRARLILGRLHADAPASDDLATN